MKSNGFTVEAIGPVKRIAGGWVRRVRIVDRDAYLFGYEYNAVCDCNGQTRE